MHRIHQGGYGNGRAFKEIITVPLSQLKVGCDTMPMGLPGGHLALLIRCPGQRKSAMWATPSVYTL